MYKRYENHYLATPNQMEELVKKITHNGELFAMIIRGVPQDEGAFFYTPNDLSQQVAVMKHSAGRQIDAHIHKPHKREVHYTQEVLILRKGTLRMDIYDPHHNYLKSYLLRAGDIALLVAGGHGFEVVDDVEMIEVKQGPFLPEADKMKIPAVNQANINIEDL